MGKGMSAIIVEQLIEEGVLDLDEDVNRYLKSAKVSGPKVTLRMLLGHRGAFDDDLTGLFAPLDGDTSMTTAELNRRLEAARDARLRICLRQPGIRRGGPDSHRRHRKILRRAVSRTIVRAGGNDRRGAGQAGGWRCAPCALLHGAGPGSPAGNARYPLYRDGLRGAGGVAASAADIARYMRLLLNGGTLDGSQVLSPSAFADLTNFDHYRFHPGMPGLGRGFIQFEEFRGFEYAGGGSIPGFSSIMLHLPRRRYRHFRELHGRAGGLVRSHVHERAARPAATSTCDPKRRRALALSTSSPTTSPERFIPANRPRSSESKGNSCRVRPATASRTSWGATCSASTHSRTYVTRLGGWMRRLRRAARRAGCNQDERRCRGVRYAASNCASALRRREGPASGFRRAADGSLHGRWTERRHVSPDQLRSNLPTWSVFRVRRIAAGGADRVHSAAALVPPSVRRLAKWLLIGFALVLGGLLAEWQWGVELGIVRGDVLLPALWRIALACRRRP